MLDGILKKIFGDKNQKDLNELLPIVDLTNKAHEKLQSISDDELRNKTYNFKKIISDKTSDAERPSTVVPAILKKSSSATPVVNLGTFVLAIPNVSVACFASSCVCIADVTPLR